jgi:hypothetical protein
MPFSNRLLPSERAALSETGLATSWLAPVHSISFCPCIPAGVDLQDLRAALADDDCVCVREDGGDGEAAGALDVHEEGAGCGHEALELVLASLAVDTLVDISMYRVGDVCVRGRGGVEEVNCENLVYC